MTQFLTSESPIPSHVAFPSFLLAITELSDSAKIIYCVLLCRAQLSQKRDGFTDEHGRIFIYYPIKDLAEAVHKSEMSVKTALRQYKIYSEKAKAFNPAEFWSARMKIRPAKEKSAETKLKSSYGKNYREVIFLSAINDTDAANRNHFDVQTIDKPYTSKTIHKPHIK